MLTNKLRDDLIKALKSQDKIKVTVIRNLMAEVKNREIDLQHELSDSETVALIRKQVKILADAQDMFRKGSREDLVKANQVEIDFLSAYLPAEISEAELTEKVRAVVAKNQAITNDGALIGICIKELKDVAEGNRIAQIVKSLQQS